ncbi:MAG: endonuclease MutS2 [Chloroflexaceae bacterium]|nr:endonuclease MutS2 [Chloroflexaceae bacterium]
MTIAQHTLETLEFPKVLAQLARHTAFSASRELALALRPSTDAYDIAQWLNRTDEARRLLDERPDVTIGGTRDVRGPAAHAARGGVLEGATLLQISDTLASMRRLRGVLLKLDPAAFPQLSDYAVSLPQLPALEEEIGRAIGDDGNVLDSASAELARLRREIRIAFNRLQEKLQSIITSTQYAGALQEPIITVRNGRYVVPVKSAQRRSISGLIHDQSGSGSTVYVEPLAVVELNNQWRELQLAEAEEVARILAALSDRVGSESSAIISGVDTAAMLDLAFAQAKYATELRCVKPEVVELPADHMEQAESPQLLLTEARHPLLNQQRVVPITVELGGSFRILLITGPNTGGKTVALKTTGLLALMAQAGMHIPASAPSRLPVFGQIFADIGDEQSIEQSLSTFSSHMTNIIRILRQIDEPDTDDYHQSPISNLHSLVLLDELGAGTDPVEGAALARVIIERLLERGCYGVATTHYAELKAFAYNTPGVQNGSVEFNVETLAPTYRLTIGLPGRSNALAIASRLGLAGDLVERARSTMRQEEAQVEDLLAGIHREREAVAEEVRRAEELRADAEKYRDRLSKELQEFEDTRQARDAAARQELEDELREVRGQLRRLRDEFRSVSVSRQWMEEAEQRLQSAQASVREGAAKAQAAAAAAVPATPPQQAPRPLQPGDKVHVRSVGLVGEIVTIDEDDEQADVQVGGFRMRVGLNELRREKGGSSSQSSSSGYTPPQRTVSLPSAPDVGMTFDMRGWRAGEVPDKLDRYLNDAYLSGLPQVRLIHGKGTGALRQVVRDVLHKHPLVASFGNGGQDGGDGVTVAKLVER